MALSAACALLKVPVSGHLGSGVEGRGLGLETALTGPVEGGVQTCPQNKSLRCALPS